MLSQQFHILNSWHAFPELLFAIIPTMGRNEESVPYQSFITIGTVIGTSNFYQWKLIDLMYICSFGAGGATTFISLRFPKAKTAIARTFGEEHRRYTRLKNFDEGIKGYLFQGRVNSVVLTSGTGWQQRYVGLNPACACTVGHGREYPWSSAAFNNDPKAVIYWGRGRRCRYW